MRCPYDDTELRSIRTTRAHLHGDSHAEDATEVEREMKRLKPPTKKDFEAMGGPGIALVVMNRGECSQCKRVYEWNENLTLLEPATKLDA